jgi:hypothetical protein
VGWFREIGLAWTDQPGGLKPGNWKSAAVRGEFEKSALFLSCVLLAVFVQVALVVAEY